MLASVTARVAAYVLASSAAETMRGAPQLRPLMGLSLRRAEQAAAVMTSSVAAGLLRPMDPLLRFHIWAVTRHFADYEHEIRFFHG